MANFEPNSARDLINRFITTIGARDETGVVPFVQAWPRIVGQDKAAHSQVLDVKNGTVLIGVDHPAWLQKMHMDRTRTVARIQQEFPSLNARNLAFTIVNELTNPWQGESGEDDGDRQSTPAEQPRADHVRRNSGTSAVEHPPDETPPGNAAPSAAEDNEFQRRLHKLKEALEDKEHGEDHQSD